MKDAKKPEYVSKPRLEYNAQMWVLLYGLWRLQQLATGMNFRLPWLDAAGKLFTVLFPILFFMGDTPAHDKLCCLRIHPKAQFVCRMCNISRENLDVLAQPYEQKKKPLSNVLSLRTTVVNQKTHTEIIGPVMVVAGLG